MPDEMIAVLQEHPDLGVVISHTLALPRSYATNYATRIMARSYPFRAKKA